MNISKFFKGLFVGVVILAAISFVLYNNKPKTHEAIYGIEFPQGWSTEMKDGAISAQSPNFDVRYDTSGEICTRTYINSGARTHFNYVLGISPAGHTGEGGGSTVTEEKEIIVNGVPSVYHQYKPFCTVTGKSMDVHVVKNGKSYIINMDFAENYQDAEKVFIQVVNSFNISK